MLTGSMTPWKPCFRTGREAFKNSNRKIFSLTDITRGRILHWSAWIVAALVVLNGGWMAFDGTRALIVGDYITPRTGQYAGQLGPWSNVVQAAGIPPRSTLMKSIFVVYGLAYLIVMVAFLLKTSWAWSAMLIVAVLGLWYLPFGTLTNLIVIVLLLLPRLRL